MRERFVMLRRKTRGVTLFEVRIDHDRAECPNVDELITSGGLDRDSPRKDPWGEAWRVECNDDEATIVSAGRDRKLGTADDVRIPPV